MEYRGVEYAVVRTIPNGWRWSVKRDRADKVGKSDSREHGVTLAQRFIDELIKIRLRPQK